MSKPAWIGVGLLLLAVGWPAHAGKEGAARLRMLNEGYSLLYADVSGLSKADYILLIKTESDATQKMVGEVADYLGRLTGQLEELARRYPSLRLDLQPLPEMERRKQSAAVEARIQSFAPVVGRTGVDFERNLLLTLSGVLNQLRHLTRVMAEAERSDERRAFLNDAEKNLNRLYMQNLRLLNERYYVHNAFESEGG